MRVSTIAPIVLIGLVLSIGGCGGSGGGGGSAGEGSATPAGGAATDAPPSGPVDGGDGGSTTGASDLDVCSLLSASDVEAILGEPAEVGIDDSSVDLRACHWTGAVSPTETVAVSIYVHPDAATAREQYLYRNDGLDGVEILGLADEALYVEGYGLQVLSGRYDLGIDNTGDDRKGSSLKLAQQILPQLP